MANQTSTSTANSSNTSTTTITSSSSSSSSTPASSSSTTTSNSNSTIQPLLNVGLNELLFCKLKQPYHLLNDPRLLDCGFSACYSCITECCNKVTDNKQQHHHPQHVQFKCVYCTNIHKLPADTNKLCVNKNIQNFLSKYYLKTNLNLNQFIKNLSNICNNTNNNTNNNNGETNTNSINNLYLFDDKLTTANQQSIENFDQYLTQTENDLQIKIDLMKANLDKIGEHFINNLKTIKKEVQRKLLSYNMYRQLIENTNQNLKENYDLRFETGLNTDNFLNQYQINTFFQTATNNFDTNQTTPTPPTTATTTTATTNNKLLNQQHQGQQLAQTQQQQQQRTTNANILNTSNNPFLLAPPTNIFAVTNHHQTQHHQQAQPQQQPHHNSSSSSTASSTSTSTSSTTSKSSLNTSNTTTTTSNNNNNNTNALSSTLNNQLNNFQQNFSNSSFQDDLDDFQTELTTTKSTTSNNSTTPNASQKRHLNKEQAQFNKFVREEVTKRFGENFLIQHEVNQLESSIMGLIRSEAISSFLPKGTTPARAWTLAKVSLRSLKRDLRRKQTQIYKKTDCQKLLTQSYYDTSMN